MKGCQKGLSTVSYERKRPPMATQQKKDPKDYTQYVTILKREASTDDRMNVGVSANSQKGINQGPEAEFF
jgi:hypothetical protein